MAKNITSIKKGDTIIGVGIPKSEITEMIDNKIASIPSSSTLTTPVTTSDGKSLQDVYDIIKALTQDNHSTEKQNSNTETDHSTPSGENTNPAAVPTEHIIGAGYEKGKGGVNKSSANFILDYHLPTNVDIHLTKFLLTAKDGSPEGLKGSVTVFTVERNGSGEPLKLTLLKKQDVVLKADGTADLDLTFKGDCTVGWIGEVINSMWYKFPTDGNKRAFQAPNKATDGLVLDNDKMLKGLWMEQSEKFTLMYVDESGSSATVTTGPLPTPSTHITPSSVLPSNMPTLLVNSSKELTANSGDSLMMFGSSLTESINIQAGCNWVERLNDMVDMPIVNNAVGGMDRKYSIQQIVNDKKCRQCDAKISEIKPTYMMFNCNANGTPAGKEGFDELKHAKYVTEAVGAKMIVGDEEIWGDMEMVNASFARQYNLPYSNVSHISKKCYDNQYKGDIYMGHRNWRGIMPNMKHLDLLEKIPVRTAIKAYKVRPKYKVTNVNDLAYDNNDQRLYKFTALSAGLGYYDNVQKNFDFNNADNQDGYGAKNLTTSDTIDTKKLHISEQGNWIAGKDVIFDKYALIECILDVSKLTSFYFEVGASVKTKVYIASMPVDNVDRALQKVYTKFTEIPTTFSNGKISFKLTDKDVLYRCLNDSKVKILLESNNFALSNPRCVYDGKQKIEEPLNYTQRKYGTKLFSDTGFDGSNWEIEGSGATVVALPKNIEIYTKYNNQKKVMLLKDNTSIIKRTVVNTNHKRVAVRIVALNFYKYMTKRFDLSGTLPAEYTDYVSNNKVLLGYHEYDYGKLLLTINGFVHEFTLMPGWSELYAEFDVQEEDNLKFTLQRMNYSDGIYTSDDCPCMIHDISVEEIN